VNTARTAARRAALAVACCLAGAPGLAACGTTQAGHEPLPTVTISADPQLGTTVQGGAGTWAVVPMGTSGADLFWELLLRPPGGTAWKVVTPPGVADNGGLVVAAGTGRSLTAGFRPSQYLTFSPLAATTSAGKSWTGLPAELPGGFAASPDALASRPDGSLIGLTAAGGGALYTGTTGGTSWTLLSSRQKLAATSAGRACGVTALTAVTVTSSGAILAAAACAHPGTVGVFALSGGTWRSATPPAPAGLRGATLRVIRLTTTAVGTSAVFTASSAGTATVLAGWTHGAGRWSLSGPLGAGTGHVLTSGPGTGTEMYVLLRTASGTRLEVTSGPGQPWTALPAPPAGTAAVLLGPGLHTDALTTVGSKFTDWTSAPGSRSWTKGKTVNVSIPYGSSG
jgi:hypothetical protein